MLRAEWKEQTTVPTRNSKGKAQPHKEGRILAGRGRKEEEMMVKIDSEKVAEVRNALQIIMSEAQLIIYKKDIYHVEECFANRLDIIIKQVKRIDKLLPPVKFEGRR